MPYNRENKLFCNIDLNLTKRQKVNLPIKSQIGLLERSTNTP